MNGIWDRLPPSESLPRRRSFRAPVTLLLSVIWLILLLSGLNPPEFPHPVRIALPWGLGLALFVTWNWKLRSGMALATVVIGSAYLPAIIQRATAERLLELLSVSLGTPLALAWIHRCRQQLQREALLARRDYLTNLANRPALLEALASEFGRLARSGRPCSVVLLDCDGFKALNDTYGHDLGDQALVQIAQVMRKYVRNYDTIARLGGDEFVMILAEADLEEAEEIMERIFTQLRFAVERTFPQLSMSAGVVVFRHPPESVEDGLKLADQAMYSARKHGRGRVQFEIYPPEGLGLEPFAAANPPLRHPHG